MVPMFRARLLSRAWSIAASFLLAIFCLSSAVRAHAGVIMQAFYWDAPSSWDHSWWSTVGNKSQELSQSGFTAIWLPPAMKSAAGGYSVGYDPYDDYDLGNKDQRGTIGTRWGRKHELVKAVAQIHTNGMQVYGDFVLAHRNGDDGQKNFRYRTGAGQPTGGRFEKTWEDFTDQNSIFGRSLNHYSGRVQWELKRAGVWQAETLGLDGIRVDYAKGIPNWFLRDYFNSPVLDQKLGILEYWDEDVNVVSGFLHGELNGRAQAFDFPLWGILKDMGNGGGYFNMRRLVGAGLVGRDPTLAVTFVENHDTDANFPTYKNKSLGYAFILTSEGYPSVFWKDYYVYGMKPQIDNLVWIHEHLAFGSTVYRWADDDLLIYERQGGAKLLVGMNDSEAFDRNGYVPTNFGAHVTLHDYTGHHGDVVTDDNGGVNVAIHANSYAAYAPFVEMAPFRPSWGSATQVFSGADDLDIPAANPDSFTTIETLSLAGGESASWRLESLESNCDTSATVELRMIKNADAESQASVLMKKHVASLCSAAGISGDLKVKTDDAYRFEVRIKPQGGGRTSFRFTIQYRAPRGA